MTTEPTITTSPIPTPRMPGRSTRRGLLVGATLVLAAAGVATAAPASAEVVQFSEMRLDSACKSPGHSGPVPNAYYVSVTLFGGAGSKSFTFDSLSIKGGPALTSITPKQVTVPGNTGNTTVTLLVEGATNSANGVGTLTTDVVGSGYRTHQKLAIKSFQPTHDGTCAVPAPTAPSVP
ncbi:MAG: hypothetical protein ABJA89_04750 [Lapillicoccus sp.]